MDRRLGDRRESPFADPRFWVSVCSLLLVLVLAVLGVIWSQLARIDANLAAFTLVTTENKTEITHLKRENERLDRERQMHEARIIVLEKQGTRIEERLRIAQPDGR